jgi:hypothetical protein
VCNAACRVGLLHVACRLCRAALQDEADAFPSLPVVGLDRPRQQRQALSSPRVGYCLFLSELLFRRSLRPAYFLLPSARARARASPVDHPFRTLVLPSAWPVCSATASSPRHASCQCVRPSLVQVALRCAAQVRQPPAVIASDPMSPMSPRISPDKPMVCYAPQRTTAHHGAARHAAMRRAFRPTEFCGAALPCRPPARFRLSFRLRRLPPREPSALIRDIGCVSCVAAVLRGVALWCVAAPQYILRPRGIGSYTPINSCSSGGPVPAGCDYSVLVNPVACTRHVCPAHWRCTALRRRLTANRFAHRPCAAKALCRRRPSGRFPGQDGATDWEPQGLKGERIPMGHAAAGYDSGSQETRHRSCRWEAPTGLCRRRRAAAE